ncbi:MAG: ATP-binding cassette domain-containing protein [Verrucomicrobia bacterium]|nr:ATP-binding cassette domain-containing protein [Verrucomicrobiota bacterium]MDA1069292.1 ATP-binding cassette domain-containing protein [Verrucomicrobiota bacterium]
MPLLSLRNTTLAFGGPPILDTVQMSVEMGERVCIVGRNGEGKSTLLKIILGEQEPDAGEFERQPGLKIAKLDQDPRVEIPGTVFDVVAQGAGESALLIAEYHHITMELGGENDDKILERMHEIEQVLQDTDGWELEQKIERILTRLTLNGDAEFNTLSGGMKRRTLLAQALVAEPDLLLLDEPTNHMDIDSIRWLEDFMMKYGKSILFITHDRMFLRKLATRIIELDRGRLTSWDCSYDLFLERKATLLQAEEKENKVFDKKLSKEEVWIRKGIQARRTRNEGRVRALKDLRVERSQRRERSGTARLSMQDGASSGRKVIMAEDVSMAFDGKTYINPFTATIWRGDKIGIIGPNGSGKTTLLRLLLKQLEPVSGTVEHGSKLEIAYFDQHRSQLDPQKTLVENIWDKSDTLTFNGQPLHVMSYLQRFLFDPNRAQSSIDKLSGGERNRLMLAKLFAQPANVYVLDEPTNDLDIETMELMEEMLLEFNGTILLVSHDREFLNNITTSVLSIENGDVVEYNGGYDDYLRHQTTDTPTPKPAKPKSKESAKKARVISVSENKELESLPVIIEALEKEHTALMENMAQPDYFKTSGLTATEAAKALAALEEKQEKAFARWEELEAIPKKS